MSGQIDFTQVDSPTAPTAGVSALSFPATSTNQLKWVDADGGTNIIAGGGFTLTVPATGTVALTGLTLAQFAATTSAQLAGVINDETGTGLLVFATNPVLTTPNLGTPSALVLTNATGLPTAGLVDAAVTLAKLADLAQDQFIGRTTASTGVPETATITAAARTVLDDATVAAMATTLGLGTGNSPQFAGLTVATSTDVVYTIRSGTNYNATLALLEAGTGDVGAYIRYDGTNNRLGIWTGNNPPFERVSMPRDSTLFGINSTSPAGQIDVRQTSTTAAIPTLYLQQADVSEEFFEFDTTIGVDNAIETVGAKVLTTTHFIKVTIPGGLTRYLPIGTIA